jgi:hypothetical protein
MTIAVLAIPLIFLVTAIKGAWPQPAVPYALFGFFVLIYSSVWFWFRPTRFSIDPTSLQILWPLRTRRWPRSEIVAVEQVSREIFRNQYGYGYRIGAGGLWGGFGLLKTAKQTFLMYISRVDQFVIVRFRTGRPLLISPDKPEQFVCHLME